MKLTVSERFTLLGILPKEGSFLMIKIMRELRELLSFTEDEHAVFKFENFEQDGKVFTKWDNSAPQTREFEFGVKATELIMDTLKELDKNKKLNDSTFSLYEKFLEPKIIT